MSKVAVSCASFALIPDGNQRLAVLLNRKRTQKAGTPVFSPIGGALKVRGPGQRELAERFGVKPRDFQNGNDLRLLLQPTQLDRFEHWFMTSCHREHDVSRELWEELIAEFNLLSPDDLRFSTSGYLWHRRVHSDDKIRFVEVYRVMLENATTAKLLAAADSPNSGLAFVTEEEIMQGKANCGVLAPICRTLLVGRQDDEDEEEH